MVINNYLYIKTDDNGTVEFKQLFTSKTQLKREMLLTESQAQYIIYVKKRYLGYSKPLSVNRFNYNNIYIISSKEPVFDKLINMNLQELTKVIKSKRKLEKMYSLLDENSKQFYLNNLYF